MPTWKDRFRNNRVAPEQPRLEEDVLSHTDSNASSSRSESPVPLGRRKSSFDPEYSDAKEFCKMAVLTKPSGRFSPLNTLINKVDGLLRQDPAARIPPLSKEKDYGAYMAGLGYFVKRALDLPFDNEENTRDGKKVAEKRLTATLDQNDYDVSYIWKKNMVGYLVPNAALGFSKDQLNQAVKSAIKEYASEENDVEAMTTPHEKSKLPDKSDNVTASYRAIVGRHRSESSESDQSDQNDLSEDDDDYLKPPLL